MNEEVTVKVLRDTITDPVTGEQRAPYCRIPIMWKPEAFGRNYAQRVIKERYGDVDDKKALAALVEETFNDFVAGYNYSQKRMRVLNNGQFK